VSRYLGTYEGSGESILHFNGSGKKQWRLSEGFFGSLSIYSKLKIIQNAPNN
jgi:hypothetical protein